MPPLVTALCYCALTLLGILVACAVAKDLAVLFLRAIGHLPQAPIYGAARSGKWPAFERDVLKVHTSCAACGGCEQLQVHHILPFHLWPEGELDGRNVVVLCNKHGCHFGFGHDYDWLAYNPNVVADAAHQLQRVQHRKYK
jgi:5-methylcytosine-specific restriction enzyme A